MALYGSILDLIGDTPLVDVSSLSPKPSVRILAKLEGQNPGGSVKDRIALSMVEEAEKEGVLTPGQTILESSSGNTGIGLAMVARLKGYRLKVVLPENVSEERKQLLEVWGAEIVASPGSEGSNGAMRMAQRLAAEHPDRTVVSLDPIVCPCSTMFRIDPPHLTWVLENLVDGRVVNQITVDAGTAASARLALERMLAIT